MKNISIFIGNNANTKNIQNAVSQFICQVNYINSVFKYVKSEVKIKLFNAYCMPLYGSVLWDFCSTDFANICSLIHLICDTLPFEIQIYKRFLTFLNSIKSSCNAIINVFRLGN